MGGKLLSITEYAKVYNRSPHTVRSEVISGKLSATKEGNKWLINVNEGDQPINMELNIEPDSTLIEKLEQQIEDLRDQVQYLKEDICGKDSHIAELLKQQNQNQQIIMSMNQNQKVLVQSKRTFFQRLFGLNLDPMREV